MGTMNTEHQKASLRTGAQTIDVETALLVSLCRDIYKNPNYSIDTQQINWHRVVYLARLNKIPYHVARNALSLLDLDQTTHEKLESICAEGESRAQKMRNTLAFVHAELRDKPHLIMKTYRNFLSVTHDVDVLVREVRDIKTLFLAHHIGLYETVSSYELETHRSGLLDVEIHDNVCPGPIQIVEPEYAWRSTRYVDFCGMRIEIPSIEVDLLTHIADMQFRNYEITLGDLLYVYHLSARANWKSIKRQVLSNGWAGAFASMCSLLNGLHRFIFGGRSPIEDHISSIIETDLAVPFVIPFASAFSGLIRKGPNNVVKLFPYFSVRTKYNHKTIHLLSIRFLNSPIGRLANDYIYYQ